jgi:hypothetical protein
VTGWADGCRLGGFNDADGFAAWLDEDEAAEITSVERLFADERRGLPATLDGLPVTRGNVVCRPLLSVLDDTAGCPDECFLCNPARCCGKPDCHNPGEHMRWYPDPTRDRPAVHP